jgi:hypothetical protein
MMLFGSRLLILGLVNCLAQEVCEEFTTFISMILIHFEVETAKTFVGTSQYVSPELLEANETSKRPVITLLYLDNAADFVEMQL